MDTLTAQIDLCSDLSAPRTARRVAVALLEGWHIGDQLYSADMLMPTVDVVELLTSELVSNAVEHVDGQTTVHLRVHYADGRLEVSVTDASTVAPIVHHLNGATSRGRGMFLIDRLADRWGCERLPDGKRVWFQMSTRLPDTQGRSTHRGLAERGVESRS